MSPDVYNDERERLHEVLADAISRGDYDLEMDVKEALVRLMEKYYGESE